MPDQTPAELFPADVYAEMVRLSEQAHPTLVNGAIERLERYHQQYDEDVTRYQQYIEASRRGMRALLVANTAGAVLLIAAIGEPKVAVASAAILGGAAVVADRRIGSAENIVQSRTNVIAGFLDKARQNRAQQQDEGTLTI
jgi:hypothetical protein